MGVLVVIAIACSIGTVVPQGSQVAGYLGKHPGAAGRMELLGFLGLTNVFHCWWFIGLLCLLAATVGACSYRRFKTVRRTTGFAHRRALGSMLTHISILLILAGGVIRAIWGEKGYLQLSEGQISSKFQLGSGWKGLPFEVELVDFEVETYAQGSVADGKADAGAAVPPPQDMIRVEWPAKGLSVNMPVEVGRERLLRLPGDTKGEHHVRLTVLKYLPDFVIDSETREVTSRSNEPNNPAVLLKVRHSSYQNNRWLFARFPTMNIHPEGTEGADQGNNPFRFVYLAKTGQGAAPRINGPIKSFKSSVKVIEEGQTVQTPLIEVNRPFSYKGYTFYQSGYDPKNLSWSSFRVVRDPGVPVVYAGFAVMIVGLFIVFYLNPWIEGRRRNL